MPEAANGHLRADVLADAKNGRHAKVTHTENSTCVCLSEPCTLASSAGPELWVPDLVFSAHLAKLNSAGLGNRILSRLTQTSSSSSCLGLIDTFQSREFIGYIVIHCTLHIDKIRVCVDHTVTSDLSLSLW